MDVEGWPVLVALHILTMAPATLDLSLSASDDVHTNLTLSHKVVNCHYYRMSAVLLLFISSCFQGLRTNSMTTRTRWLSGLERQVYRCCGAEQGRGNAFEP